MVAAVDRGNYPVVSFHPEDGDTLEWYPSVAAARCGEIVFGFDAAQKQGADGWDVLRAFKRRLGTIGPDERVEIGDHRPTAMELLTGFLSALRLDLLARSNLRVKRNEKLQAMISVPANSNSNQRFITLEAFRRAGFDVRGMMNEPSAAGIEYAHHLASGGPSKRATLVVYDLGGGTFDSSVINLVERDHEALASEGIAKLGGDDFDTVLLNLALKAGGLSEVPDAALVKLLEECRHKKESLHPNTRRITIDLGLGVDGAGEVTVAVSDFYKECKPLIESTIEAMESVMEKSAREAGLDLLDSAVYLVGGSSDLPLVARTLKEKYGKQVRRSPYPHAATAIGLAIAADTEAGYKLRERFTRHFGVWREWDDGRQIAFDPLFEKNTPLPLKGEQPLLRVRRYAPIHNVGHFRYLECSRLDQAGQPQGDLAPWDEILFPFDPALRGAENLKDTAISHARNHNHVVEEVYSCDHNGVIEVEIKDADNGFSRRYTLRRK